MEEWDDFLVVGFIGWLLGMLSFIPLMYINSWLRNLV